MVHIIPLLGANPASAERYASGDNLIQLRRTELFYDDLTIMLLSIQRVTQQWQLQHSGGSCSTVVAAAA